jgi:hypothetical protein
MQKFGLAWDAALLKYLTLGVTGYLISGLNDFLVLFRRVLSGEFDKHITLSGVDRRLYVSLVEPVIEWIMQCILKNSNQVQ